MSKKDNLKFKKRIKSQILQEISHAQENTSPQNEKVAAAPRVVSENIVSPTSPTVNPSDDSTKLVKADLKKSGVIIGSIIILIVAIYFIDHQTGFLLKAGSSLFTFLHISA
jgi:hypothetical protein